MMYDVTDYKSEIALGGRYRDTDTKFEGVAGAVTFYRNKCERVMLIALVSSVPAEHWFDGPNLERVDNQRKGVGFTDSR